MKILLVYPPISKFERYSSELGCAGGQQIPLGVYYLASYMRHQGHQVDVLDAEAMSLTADSIVQKVNQTCPEVIGISSTTVAFHRAVELAWDIKRSHPEVKIILGGPHVSSNVYDAMAQECFDFGVIGEGELTLKELVSAIERNQNLHSIDGLAFRVGGSVAVNAPRQYIANLDELPFPAYDLVTDMSFYNPPPSNYKKLPVANIITSRGCPNHCTFCDQSIFGNKLRQRSAANVADEIALLYREYGVREIAFVDDTFTINSGRIRDLFDILSSMQIRFPWTCASRINTVTFEDLKFMQSVGCWHISFGIESGNLDILKIIRKNISLEQASKVIGWCAKLGIKTKGFFMVGHPTETIETIDETIQFALATPLDDVLVTINTPIPGTTQYKEATTYGKLDTTDWSQYNYWRPVFVPRELTQEILLEKHREFYKRFYLRPKMLVRYLFSFFSSGGMRRFNSIIRSLPFLFRKNSKNGNVTNCSAKE